MAGLINIGAAAEAAKDKREAEAAKDKREKGNPFTRIFSAWIFKLPNKRMVFTNDDKSETEKLAYVTFKLALPDGLHQTMRASIYESRKLNGDCELYLAMPTSGKGFPQPIFTAEDPQTQAVYDAFRLQVAQDYERWEADLKKEGKTTGAVAAQSSHIVRHRPAKQPTA